MPAHFQRFLRAIETHDVEAALALLSEDFQLVFVEHGVTLDKSAMVDVLGWDRAVNGSLAFADLQVSDRSVAGLFTERNDFLELIGIPHLQARVVYELGDGGLIERQTYEPLPRQPSIQAHLEPAIEWARANRPAALEEVYPGEQMSFDEASGRKWISLLEAWREAGDD